MITASRTANAARDKPDYAAIATDRVRDSARNLCRLVDDVLEVTRWDAGAAPVELGARTLVRYM